MSEFQEKGAVQIEVDDEFGTHIVDGKRVKSRSLKHHEPLNWDSDYGREILASRGLRKGNPFRGELEVPTAPVVEPEELGFLARLQEAVVRFILPAHLTVRDNRRPERLEVTEAEWRAFGRKVEEALRELWSERTEGTLPSQPKYVLAIPEVEGEDNE
jgi:hypothetical protein